MSLERVAATRSPVASRSVRVIVIVMTAPPAHHAEIQNRRTRANHIRVSQKGGWYQLVGRHGMPSHGVRKQGFEQGRTFGVFDPPSNDAAAEDIEDDVKGHL